MIQDRILKIIKGLNTFSPDDIIALSGFDETDILNILD
jgi:hypothetical protein